jgi:hypothetical protein
MNRADLRPSINIMTLGDGKLNTPLFAEKNLPIERIETSVAFVGGLGDRQRLLSNSCSRRDSPPFFLLIRPLLLTPFSSLLHKRAWANRP